MKWKVITREVVLELLHYDSLTGVFTWNERGRRWFKSDRAHRWWNSRNAGNRAGHVFTSKRTGYQRRDIGILGFTCLEHHLAWLYMTDKPLPNEIDHRDRDATNNKWANLRASTHQQNSCNRSKSTCNTSGVTGVTWFKPHSKWMVRCQINGEKNFLGYFDELDEAAMEVMEFRAELGFDPMHGINTPCYPSAAQAIGASGIGGAA